MADAGDQVALLWNFMFPTMQTQILDKGNFTSWAAMLTSEGKIESLLSTLYRKDRAKFRPMLREQAATGRFIAIASITNVAAEVHEAEDALVGILLEFDSPEISLAFFYPYTVLEGEVVLGELHQEKGDYAVFPAPPPPMPAAEPPPRS